MSLLNFQGKKRKIFSSGQQQQQRISEQEDTLFQSSQDYNGSQMMNSQENSQSSSFDLFSQMMSQQQGHSQQNEIAPSHRFYTKYMSKAPLFPRDSSQTDRNPLPRRRSYHDLQEANRQRAKDRDDRDLINTFIALVKECADEVKSAADDIKSNVDRSMKESANKSATLMKKINEDLSEHYNTLLDSIKEQETETAKIAELEQALASKEARIEVLESQLEIAKQAKDERVIQSIVNAYKEQQKVNKDYFDKIHEQQQKFTKEQVENIKIQQQEQIVKSHSVEFSEKQPAKTLEAVPAAESNTTRPCVDGSKDGNLPVSRQQSVSSHTNVLQASDIHYGNMHKTSGMSTTITAIQPTQPLQMTSQMITHQAANYANLGDQRCNSRGFCIDCEYQVPRSNTSMVPLQPAPIPLSNINQSIHSTSSVLPPSQFQQHYRISDFSNGPQHGVLQSAVLPKPSSSMPSSMHSNNAILYTMTSPIPDHPTSIMWSKANRLKPSPVATVAPQVKENTADDAQEIDDSTQQSPEVQQRRSRRNSTSSKQVSQLLPQRHSARVKARTSITNNMQSVIPKTLANNTRSKNHHKTQQQKQNQQQKASKSTEVYTKQAGSRPLKRTPRIQRVPMEQQEQDIYEFQEEEAILEAPAAKRQKTGRNPGYFPSSSNHSKQRMQYNSKSNDPGYLKRQQMQTGSNRAYPDWVTQPTKNIFKKSQPKPAKLSNQWIIQDSGSTEYEFQDDSQGSSTSTQEQVQPSSRPFGNIQGKSSTKKYRPKSSVPTYYSDDESSEDISFSLQSPDMYPQRKTNVVKQVLPAVADDFLSTPCLQAQQHDSEDSQLTSGYTSAPGSAVRRKISRQAERKRRLQGMVRQVDATQTLAEISKSISRHRTKLKRSTSMLSVC